MSRPNRMHYPRLILAVNTLFTLSLTILAVVLLQVLPGLLCGVGYALGALSVLTLLPCAREWLSPSYLELSGNQAIIKWNNWRLTGTVASIDLPAKKPIRLVVQMTDAKTLIDPVGPLFLLASWITYPAIKPFSAPWWAPLYPMGKEQLGSMLGISPDGSLVITFAIRIFGKRNVRRVVKNATAGN
jgi:hypothetical protein